MQNRKILIVLTFLFLVALWVFDVPGFVFKQFYPVKYGDFVYKYAEENNLDPYLVFAIIKAESGFNPRAVSKKNAKGLMQITDETAQWGAARLGMTDFKQEKLFDPETNIRIGCWYLGWLTTQFRDIDLVIAAYNSGNGNVSKWLKDKNLSNTGEKLKKIPFRETDNFLKRVKSFWKHYNMLYDN